MLLSFTIKWDMFYLQKVFNYVSSQSDGYNNFSSLIKLD